MSRYIDADALHKAYIELRNFKQDPQSGDWISLRAVPLTTVIRMLNDLPSIDIVRCKECEWYLNGHLCTHWSNFGTIETLADDFCSYGERKSDD